MENSSGPATYPTHKIASKPATVSRILAEEMRLLGRRRRNLCLTCNGSAGFMASSIALATLPWGHSGNEGQPCGLCACRCSALQLRNPKLRDLFIFFLLAVNKPVQTLPCKEILLFCTANKSSLCPRGRHYLCLPKRFASNILEKTQKLPVPLLIKCRNEKDPGRTTSHNRLFCLSHCDFFCY